MNVSHAASSERQQPTAEGASWPDAYEHLFRLNANIPPGEPGPPAAHEAGVS